MNVKNAMNTTVMGNGNKASNSDVVNVIGNLNNSDNLDTSTIIGYYNKAKYMNASTLLGNRYQANHVTNSTLMGNKSQANHVDYSILIGGGASATAANKVIIMGADSTAGDLEIREAITKVYNDAYNKYLEDHPEGKIGNGGYNDLTKAQAETAGNLARDEYIRELPVLIQNSILIGNNSSTNKSNAISIGSGNTVKASGAMALGNHIVIDDPKFSNYVVLGNHSAPALATPVAGMKIGETNVTFAGGNPTSTVSVGAANNERQITHVAAGRIAADSTDAVNGSQLFAILNNHTTDGLNKKADKAELDKLRSATLEAFIESVEIMKVMDAKVDTEVSKVNDRITDVAQQVEAKANKTDVEANQAAIAALTDGLKNKADLSVVKALDAHINKQINELASRTATELDKKADQATVDMLADVVAQKANQTDVDANKTAIADLVTKTTDGLNSKADQTTVNMLADIVATKANQTDVEANKTAIADLVTKTIDGLDKKADKTAVEANRTAIADLVTKTVDGLSKKADRAAVNVLADVVATKANQRDVDTNKTAIADLTERATTYDSPTKESITLAGANGTRITNLRDGEVSAGSKDAVNGGQLHALYNYVNEGNEAFRKQLKHVKDELEAGIAGNNASASLPQVVKAGRSMVAVATGGYKNKNAIAVGYSRLSENGRVTLKGHLNADTKKNLGYGVGVGFTW
ncbi:YadA-like family protein [Mannheimia pernigra]|nr:YadA-like family protein [Mannheimia pernigra]